MPKGQKSKVPFDLKLLDKGKPRTVKPEAMAQIRAMSGLRDVPASVLEIGKRLVERWKENGQEPGGEAFELSTPELKARAGEVQDYMVKHLRKVVKTLGPGGLTATGARHQDDLVFWVKRSFGPGKKKP